MTPYLDKPRVCRELAELVEHSDRDPLDLLERINDGEFDAPRRDPVDPIREGSKKIDLMLVEIAELKAELAADALIIERAEAQAEYYLLVQKEANSERLLLNRTSDHAELRYQRDEAFKRLRAAEKAMEGPRR